MNTKSFNPRALSLGSLFGLVVALVAPFLIYLLLQRIYGSEQSAGRIAVGIGAHWVNLVALIFVVLRVERSSLITVGLRPLRWWTIPLGLLAGGVITVVSSVITQTFHLGSGSDQSYASFLQSLPFWERLLLVVTAGVFEETLYRGYALERLASIFGNKWVAGLVTVALFTAMHAPVYGWSHLLPIATVASLVTLLYLWRRDLVVNIVAHSTIDGIGLLLMPLVEHSA